MRLSQYRKAEIMHGIMDIYDEPLSDLEKQKSQFVIDNYNLWISQYTDDIKKLPKQFFNLSHSLRVEIKDNIEPDHIKAYRWTARHDEEVPVMRENNSYYSDTAPIEVQEALKVRVKSILEQERTIDKEISNLKMFVVDCLDQVTTTKQLREIWKDYPALAKHIPAEPARKKRAKQVELNLNTTLDVDAVNRRVTMNILEG